jgi:hypothetical protein
MDSKSIALTGLAVVAGGAVTFAILETLHRHQTITITPSTGPLSVSSTATGTTTGTTTSTPSLTFTAEAVNGVWVVTLPVSGQSLQVAIAPVGLVPPGTYPLTLPDGQQAVVIIPASTTTPTTTQGTSQVYTAVESGSDWVVTVPEYPYPITVGVVGVTSPGQYPLRLPNGTTVTVAIP